MRAMRLVLLGLLLSLPALAGCTSQLAKAPPPRHAEPLPPAAKTPSGPFVVHVIDVGTGLSVFVRGPDFALLYDAGSNDDLAAGANNRVLAYLKAVAPDLHQIDHVILSHPHQDHVALLADVVGRYDVKHIWDSGAVNSICSYRHFLEAIAAKGTATGYRTAAFDSGSHAVAIAACRGQGEPTVTLEHGPRLTVPLVVELGASATLTFLYADGTSHPTDFNANSLVARLDLGGVRVLLPGDAQGGGRAEPATAPKAHSIEAALAACCATELKADVLIVGHHGSKTSTRQAFLQAIAPKVTVISSGPHKYSGVTLPDAEVVEELRATSEVYRTDEHDVDCATNAAKIGIDADGKPGGCDNVQIQIVDGVLAAPSYWNPGD